MSQQIGLLGNGGQADETESYLNSDTQVSFRAVSPEYINSNDTLVNIEQPGSHKDIPVIAAFGAPGVRKDMVAAWNGEKYFTLISERAYVDEDAEIGEGTVIAPLAAITTNVQMGKHVLINIAATVSHNSKLGDYATISPGAHIAGNVVLGAGVFVGIGAVISNNVKVADGSVIGAGAVVLEDIEEENSVVIGIPGRVIKKNNGWLREL